MTMKNNPRRMPAEWETGRAVMVAWPHADTDWNYMLEEAQECYDSLIRAICRHSAAIVVAPDVEPLKQRFADIPRDRIFFFQSPTNDTWTRDYGPITVQNAAGEYTVCDFGFNAWGGKFEHELDNGVTRRMHASGLLRGNYEDHNDFILEGGSIESDGRGTVLTTESCLLTPTRNSKLTRDEIELRLKQSLGAEKVLWLDCGDMIGDDTDGHIDTIARLAPNNTILYCGSDWNNADDEQSQILSGMQESLSRMTTAAGEPFNLIQLPLPAAVYDPEDGHRLPATYANFLIVNDAVLMPVYGQPDRDLHAEMALRVAFPEHIIERVDCRALIRQHGSLHCATMQIPFDVLNI